MENTKKDYFDLLNETIEYFKTHERCVDATGTCKYYYEGNMCAIGRLLKNPKEFRNYIGCVSTLHRRYSLIEILKDKYVGFDVAFLQKIQELHDLCNAWNTNNIGNTLNETGEDIVQRIEKYINEKVMQA